MNARFKPGQKDNIETVLISVKCIIFGGESNPPSLDSHEDTPYEILVTDPKLLNVYLSERMKNKESEFYETVSKALKRQFTLFLPSALSFADNCDGAEVILEDRFELEMGLTDYGLERLPILQTLRLEQSLSPRAVLVYRKHQVIDGYNLRGLPKDLFPKEQYCLGARR